MPGERAFGSVRSLLDAAAGVTTSAVTTAMSAGGQTVGTLRQLTSDLGRVADALERIAAHAGALDDIARLANHADSLDRLAETGPGLDRLALMVDALGPLSQAVAMLNDTVGQLNATVVPLQGTAERVGRMMDRLPRKRTDRDLESGPA